MKLTGIGRILVAIVAAALLGLAYYYVISPMMKARQEASANTASSSNSNSGTYESSASSSASASNSSASSNGATTTNNNQEQAAKGTASGGSYQSNTPPPVNGRLKGVVELGASGFNSFIVTVDKSKNWKLDKSEFGNSMVIENMATEDDIRIGLKRYIAGMLDYGVSGKDVHFVVSSGAQKSDVTLKIIAVLRKMGYFVNTVTPEEEGKLALRCVLPADQASRAFVADIGSGNTKISWQNGSSVSALETYGAKYFEKQIDDATVYADVKTKAQGVPASKREMCFIIGGVPFEMAKEVRNGKERYTTLKAADAYKFDKAKSKAGQNIYKALADATGCRQFVFDWDANFTIGFLLNLP